jgi:hypothetical protein
MSNTEAEFDFDAEMALTLDSLPEMPSIDPWKSGTYSVKLSTETKQVKMKLATDKEAQNYPCLQINMVLEEGLLEVDETSPGIVPKVGDKIGILCNLRMEMGLANIRTILGPLAIHANAPKANIAQLRELADGASMAVVISSKLSKDKSRINNNVREAAVAG